MSVVLLRTVQFCFPKPTGILVYHYVDAGVGNLPQVNFRSNASSCPWQGSWHWFTFAQVNAEETNEGWCYKPVEGVEKSARGYQVHCHGALALSWPDGQMMMTHRSAMQLLPTFKTPRET